jgi:hypothetical protein
MFSNCGALMTGFGGEVLACSGTYEKKKSFKNFTPNYVSI